MDHVNKKLDPRGPRARRGKGESFPVSQIEGKIFFIEWIRFLYQARSFRAEGLICPVKIDDIYSGDIIPINLGRPIQIDLFPCMARISRIVVPEYLHPVTQRGVRSLAIFQNDEQRRSYLDYWDRQAEPFEVEILAWCLLTNHVPFIAVAKKEDSLAPAFGEGHRRYTRMKNFRGGVRGYLFQGRFSSWVGDEPHLLAATSYEKLNPVRAGLGKKAWVYPWSGAAFPIGQSPKDPLLKDPSLRGLGKEWEDF